MASFAPMKPLLLFMLVYSWSFGQDYTQYTVDDGLPGNHVYDVTQSHDGYIWFATNRGVVKFDGHTFRTFNLKDGLPTTDVYNLMVDKEGRVWYNAKSKRLGYLQNDSVYTFPTSDDYVSGVEFINQTKFGVWYGNYRLDQTTFKRLPASEELYKLNDPHYLASHDVKYHDILFESDQGIVITSKKVSLVDKYLNEVHGSFHGVSEGMLDTPIKSGFLPNSIAFFCFREVVVFYNYAKNSFKTIANVELSQGLTRDNVFITPLRNKIQVSMTSRIFEVNYDLELVKEVQPPLAMPGHKKFLDKSGNLWSVDFSKGVCLIRAPEVVSQRYLMNQKVQVLEFVGHQLFAGTHDSGFYSLEEETAHFSQYIPVGNNCHAYQIKKGDKGNVVYFISSGRNCFVENDQLSDFDFRIKNEDGQMGRISRYKEICELHEKMYVTTSNGLFRVDMRKKSGIQLHASNGLHDLATFNEAVYVGSTNGLMVFKDDELVNLQVNNDYLSIPVTELLACNDYLIVGTSGRGVYLYVQGSVVPINSTDGLTALSIVKDGNYLWLGTESGVKKVRLNKSDLGKSPIVDAFYKEDGLLQNNVNYIALKDSFLFVATDIGLSSINTESEVYKILPKLVFKDKKDTLSFYHTNGNHVEIAFGVLDFVNQRHFRFQYRLLPLQKEWSETRAQSLNFDDLNPGLYSLEVKVTDQHNNTTVKRKYIHVIPNWWQTTLSRVIFGVLVLGFVIMLFLWNRNRVRKKERKKAQFEKRVVGLELQALRSQMNPHFVFNTLNAIQYYIQRNEVERSEYYLVNFSKLIRLFFEYSRQQSISLRDEVELLEKYLLLEQLRFEEKLNFQISVDDEIDQDERMIPSMILQPIVENAVNHGIFHKEENGKIEIRFGAIDSLTFRVTIKDNGIGIEKANKIKKESTKNYKSNSSAVLKERVALLNQSKDWSIQYSMGEANNMGTGTIFELKFAQLL